MEQTKKNRILYLDILRALAVFMMIQGHTVDTFLSDAARSTDSLFYVAWYTMRGFTAPVFMFTAGVVFTYLLRMNDFTFRNNPRIKKGIKRGVTLIGIGYLLRYPTARIFDFRYVTPEKWSVFFSVDALHLIGSGLLLIIALVYLVKKFNVKYYAIALSLLILLLFATPVAKQIVFTNYIPEFFAAYLNNKTGSHFPFLPWLVYIISGSILGLYLRNNKDVYKSSSFSLKLFTIGGGMIGMFYITSYIQDSILNEKNIWLSSTGIIGLRLGYVILLNGLLSFIVRKVKQIPQIIIHAGRNTLILYIVHLVMLYGSAWSLGLGHFYARSFDTAETVLSAVAMLSLMLLLVLLIEKVKTLRNIKLVTENI